MLGVTNLSQWQAFIGFLTGVKLQYLIGLAVAWNICCGVGIYLNGGQSQIRTLASAVFIVLTVALFAFVFFLLRSDGSVQAAVLKPTADLEAVEQFALYTAGTLAILALLFAVALGVSMPLN